MVRDAIERIRTATFPVARKGYEKREVHKFLDELAAWLETGGSDDARADLVRDELQRVGERTAAILTEAHEIATELREEAEREFRRRVSSAGLKSEEVRAEADEYAQETRADADTYARRTREEAESEAAGVRQEVEEYAAKTRAAAEEGASDLRKRAEAFMIETRERAEQTVKQMVDEANRRRDQVELAIAGLEERRTGVIAELRRLASDATSAAGSVAGSSRALGAASAQGSDGAAEEAAVEQGDTADGDRDESEEPTRAIPTPAKAREDA